MTAAKEALLSVIESLDDSEAQQVAELIRTLQKQRGVSPTLGVLAADPSFDVDLSDLSHFRVVEPMRVKGLPASTQLLRDRR